MLFLLFFYIFDIHNLNKKNMACINQLAPGIFAGRTDVDTNPWNDYIGPTPATSGLFLDLDYSSAGFSDTPIIIPALIGITNNWVMQVTVAEQNSSTARIYIRSTLDGYVPTASEANDLRWTVNFAIYGNVEGVTPCTFTWTIATHPCDGWV